METWMWIVGALLLGAILGGGSVALVARRRRGDAETVSRLKAELDEYRQEVSEHFVQTAELVNNLTRSYKAVYEHLEQGAYRLVGEETLQKQLDVTETEPVRLEYIGRRDKSTSTADAYARRESSARVLSGQEGEGPTAGSREATATTGAPLVPGGEERAERAESEGAAGDSNRHTVDSWNGPDEDTMPDEGRDEGAEDRPDDDSGDPDGLPPRN